MGKRLEQLRYLNRAGTKVIQLKLKEKIAKARADKRYVALPFIEAILSIMLAIALAVYWAREKPELYRLLNFFHKFGLMQNDPQYWIDKIPAPPFSYFLFLIWVAIIFWLYSYTSGFRQSNLGKGLLIRFLQKLKHLDKLRMRDIRESDVPFTAKEIATAIFKREKSAKFRRVKFPKLKLKIKKSIKSKNKNKKLKKKSR